MRLATTFAVFLFSLSAYCQDVVLASNESNKTLVLLKQANESLDQGNTRLAITIFEKMIELYEDEGRQRELPENYLGIALAFALNGNYNESIHYHKKALKAHRKYKSSEPPYEILINMGLTYQLAGRMRKAKKYLN